MPKLKRMSPGEKFNDWTVVADDESGDQRRVTARCKCGTVHRPLAHHLRSGDSRKCNACGTRDNCPGRKRTSDSPHWERLANRVYSAIRRCTVPGSRYYHRYGGRGIGVHPEWLVDPAKFVAYLLTLPGHDDPTLWMDRTDNNRGYEPGNIRFATSSDQQHNRTTRSGGAYRGRSGRWIGECIIRGKKHRLGTYGTKAEARAAVVSFKKQMGVPSPA